MSQSGDPVILTCLDCNRNEVNATDHKCSKCQSTLPTVAKKEALYDTGKLSVASDDIAWMSDSSPQLVEGDTNNVDVPLEVEDPKEATNVSASNSKVAIPTPRTFAFVPLNVSMDRNHASAFIDEPSTPIDEENSSLEAADSESEKEQDSLNVSREIPKACEVASIDEFKIEGERRERIGTQTTPIAVRPDESVTRETAFETSKQQENQSQKMVFEAQRQQALKCKATEQDNLDEDDGRDKSRRQVLKALRVDLDNAIADKVETVCYKLGRGYKSKVRELISNLKANSELRQALHSGSVTPERFCQMSPEELATRDLADLRNAERRKSLNRIVVKNKQTDFIRAAMSERLETPKLETEASFVHEDNFDIYQDKLPTNIDVHSGILANNILTSPSPLNTEESVHENITSSTPNNLSVPTKTTLPQDFSRAREKSSEEQKLRSDSIHTVWSGRVLFPHRVSGFACALFYKFGPPSLANNLKLPDKLKMTGHLPPNEVISFISDLVVSLQNSSIELRQHKRKVVILELSLRRASHTTKHYQKMNAENEELCKDFRDYYREKDRVPLVSDSHGRYKLYLVDSKLALESRWVTFFKLAFGCTSFRPASNCQFVCIAVISPKPAHALSQKRPRSPSKNSDRLSSGSTRHLKHR